MVKLSYALLPCILDQSKLLLALLVNKFLNKLGLPTQLGLDYLFIDFPPIIIVFLDARMGCITGLLTLESKKGDEPKKSASKGVLKSCNACCCN